MTTTHAPEPHAAVADDAPSADAPPTPAPAGRPADDRAVISTQTLALAGVFIAAFAFIAAVVAVGLAARSIDEHQAVAGSPAAGQSGPAPTISLTEFAITPSALTVPAGTASVTVTNEGSIAHNVTIGELATATIDGGQSTSIDLSSLRPGTYDMICSVPGHAPAGMTGTVTVT